MCIVPQSAPYLCTSSHVPILLLPAPPKRLALPAPKIAGYLAAPVMLMPQKRRGSQEKRERRVVTAEIVEQPRIDINIYEDPEGWWAEFERIFGRIRSLEEMDAELEAKHPGYLAWVARREAAKTAEIRAVRS